MSADGISNDLQKGIGRKVECIVVILVVLRWYYDLGNEKYI